MPGKKCNVPQFSISGNYVHIKLMCVWFALNKIDISFPNTVLSVISGPRDCFWNVFTYLSLFLQENYAINPPLFYTIHFMSSSLKLSFIHIEVYWMESCRLRRCEIYRLLQYIIFIVRTWWYNLLWMKQTDIQTYFYIILCCFVSCL